MSNKTQFQVDKLCLHGCFLLAAFVVALLLLSLLAQAPSSINCGRDLRGDDGDGGGGGAICDSLLWTAAGNYYILFMDSWSCPRTRAYLHFCSCSRRD